MATANFRLGQWLYSNEHVEAARPYLVKARDLSPERWHYFRQTLELEEIGKAFHVARDTVRRMLRGQIPDTHASGVVGVELSHSVRREKLSVASSLQAPTMRGWNRGALGLPYYVSGRGDAERSGWVITMHGAGTAIRRARVPSPQPVTTTMRMGATR